MVTAGTRRALITAGIFIASIPVAFVHTGAATFLWLGLFLTALPSRHGDTGG
jgi:hypothetical protein